jgi:hypothetical protein
MYICSMYVCIRGRPEIRPLHSDLTRKPYLIYITKISHHHNHHHHHYNNHHLQGLSLLARAVLKHEASLRTISGLPACCKSSHLGKPRFLIRFSYPLTGCLPWLSNPVYPPRNPGKGPSPGGTHWASGTRSSYKAGSPLPVARLSLVRVPTCYLSKD